MFGEGLEDLFEVLDLLRVSMHWLLPFVVAVSPRTSVENLWELRSPEALPTSQWA